MAKWSSLDIVNTIKVSSADGDTWAERWERCMFGPVMVKQGRITAFHSSLGLIRSSVDGRASFIYYPSLWFFVTQRVSVQKDTFWHPLSFCALLSVQTIVKVVPLLFRLVQILLWSLCCKALQKINLLLNFVFFSFHPVSSKTGLRLSKQKTTFDGPFSCSGGGFAFISYCFWNFLMYVTLLKS